MFFEGSEEDVFVEEFEQGEGGCLKLIFSTDQVESKDEVKPRVLILVLMVGFLRAFLLPFSSKVVAVAVFILVPIISIKLFPRVLITPLCHQHNHQLNKPIMLHTLHHCTQPIGNLDSITILIVSNDIDKPEHQFPTLKQVAQYTVGTILDEIYLIVSQGNLHHPHQNVPAFSQL
jgi:hypothetical protein